MKTKGSTLFLCVYFIKPLWNKINVATSKIEKRMKSLRKTIMHFSVNMIASYVLLSLLSFNRVYAQSEEPVLLFKGTYTIVTDGSPMLSLIKVYENYLMDGSSRFDYKSINSNGERVYSGNGMFNIFLTWYADPKTGNIRLVKRFNTPYGSSTVTCQVSKGSDIFINGDFRSGSRQSGGYTPSSSSNSGTTTNPVQPHQKTKSCSLCHGSGKCATCNGKHWYYGAGGSKITCPNCKPSGACSSCGGSGKKNTTEYY